MKFIPFVLSAVAAVAAPVKEAKPEASKAAAKKPAPAKKPDGTVLYFENEQSFASFVGT